MSSLVKFSEASSIALHTMALLAAAPGEHVRVGDVAARLSVSEHHLAKVLQRLARAGLVDSVRGVGGGFVLRGDPAKITLLDVYEALEGKFEVSGCLFSPAKCCGDCVLGNAVRDANALLHAHLAKTRVADVAHVFTTVPELVALGRLHS